MSVRKPALPKPLRVVVWGTYDLGKPRTPIFLKGLRRHGVLVHECHANVWKGVDDKSLVKGFGTRVKLALRWLTAYPRLVYRYLRLPPHDAVLICYLGQLDVLLIWPLARLRRVPIVWDAFLSLYDTVVNDRQLVRSTHPLAYLLYAWEWLACRAADRIIVDTHAHGDYFAQTFNVAREKFDRVLVGADDTLFAPADNSQDHRSAKQNTPFTVLFYGQFIPLHGIRYIVQAAELCRGRNVRWLLIGRGQQAPEIRALIKQLALDNLTWTEWVPYPELAQYIENADCCLGIFGVSDKARRVIPNKAYQVLAVGRPLITMDSPAARELLDEVQAITLVPAADPQAIADAVLRMAETRDSPQPGSVHYCPPASITPTGIGRQLLDAITKAIGQPRTAETQR
jgi:glycosyltransferase involved in cell wall biosynthesis